LSDLFGSHDPDQLWGAFGKGMERLAADDRL
jgi:hypothetical protein